MSVQAMAWALDHRQTGPLPAGVRLVLVSLADHADPTGRNAFCSAHTLAHRLGVTVRSVRQGIALLLDQGTIRHGDQARAEYIRADRRPTVYDLALDGVQVVVKITGAEVDLGAEPYDEHTHGMHAASPREPVDNQPRGEAACAHEVNPASPKPTTNPNPQTSNAVKVTTRRASASASHATPRDPNAPIRAMGITDRECPTCGQPIYRSHRCRSSALDPARNATADEAPELVLLNPPPPRQDPHLPIAIGDCQWCGRKVPTNTLGVCLRCAMTAARYVPTQHPLEVERP